MVQPWHVQGQRLEGWTGSEAAWGDQTGGKAYPKSTVHSLGGQTEADEPLEVGEVLLLREATIAMTDGPPARTGSSLLKHELSLTLHSLYQQVLLALSLEYNQNLTTS